MHEEEMLAVCFASVKGIGRRGLYRLLETSGSLSGIFDMKQGEIAALVGQRYAKGLLEVVGDGGRDALERCVETGEKYTAKYQKEGICCISCMSKAFPERLRQIPDPPFCLYVKGELPEERMPSVAIIGARACSAYGRSVAYSFGKELAAEGVGVISGMARGIDGIAQEGAVAGEGKTYAVLGGGVDYCYPAEHKGLYDAICKCGGVISEYSPGTMPRANFFPERNRIISGMADIVLVIEARKRSGTYITVTQALEQGKEVFAVPGRVTDVLSDGCNSLIKDGAGLADSVGTVLEALDLCGNHMLCANESGNHNVKNNGGLRGEIMDILSLTPMHLNDIHRALNEQNDVEIGCVMTELVCMELDGMIENSGNYYIKCL